MTAFRPGPLPSPMAETPPPSSLLLPLLTLTRLSNHTLFSVLSTPSTHRPALPHELILQILSHPSRWVLTSTLALSGPVRVTYHEGSRVLLCTPPFTAESLKLFRKILITIHSKDQGWSSFPADHGTYENSWTWFDMAIENNEVMQEQKRSGDSESLNVRRCLLQANRHAGQEMEEYSFSINKGEGFLKDLAVGDQIMLIACACFSGWTNSIKQAEMEIWEVDDLSKDFNVQG